MENIDNPEYKLSKDKVNTLYFSIGFYADSYKDQTEEGMEALARHYCYQLLQLLKHVEQPEGLTFENIRATEIASGDDELDSLDVFSGFYVEVGRG